MTEFDCVFWFDDFNTRYNLLVYPKPAEQIRLPFGLQVRPIEHDTATIGSDPVRIVVRGYRTKSQSPEETGSVVSGIAEGSK